MATVTDTPITGYAHCPNSRCPGTRQEAVKAIRRTTAFQYTDNGGDMPGIEKTTDHFLYADEQTDAGCKHCERTRELTDQVRPIYESLSGHPQNGLLAIQREADIANRALAGLG